ncbi:MAG: phosphodiester glycosidase family protein [Gemmatimonadetes bacterium]|nr:phosphodiester glycosidase family protein [Gemmatimonadota bacterium]
MRVRQRRRLAAVALAALAAGPAATIAPPVRPTLPRSTLAVREGGAWRTWWRSDEAPREWGPEAPLARAIAWRPLAPGFRWGRAELAGKGEAWRTTLIVVQVDPHRARLALDTAFTGKLRRAWTIDRAPVGARVALNAGQFVADLPWGWVVLDGRQYLAPGRGPLVSTLTIDTTGALRWWHGAPPPGAGGVRWAFQSYPTLLAAGRVPAPLMADTGGVDVAHRDARLAIGTRADGTLLIAMTRFGAMGESLGFVPFGLTTPEMAAVMGALGVNDGALLDGGISAQLLVREPGGEGARFPGIRRVPLGLLIFPDSAATP